MRFVSVERNWAQSPAFDDDAMAEFERRLQRARPGSRPQYLRVKGATLLELADPAATKSAVELLTRVVNDYDDSLEVPWAHELLGDAYRHTGDFERAEHHLRRCLDTANERRSGTTRTTELSLAEVLLEQGRERALSSSYRSVPRDPGLGRRSSSQRTRRRNSLDIPTLAWSRRTARRSAR